MDPLLQTLILKRFRSIPSERVNFSNPTFFVGRNGSGKSNFAEAFSFLAEAMASPLQAVFDNRGGISAVRNRTSGQSYPPNLGMCAILGALNGEISGGRYAFEVKALPNYGFEVVHEQCRVKTRQGKILWFDRAKSGFESNLGLRPALDPSALALPLVGGEAAFAPVLRTLSSMRVYCIEPAKLREMQDPDSGFSLRADGSNATSVLQEIKRQPNGDFDRIGEILATIVPNTKHVEIKKHAKKLSLEFTQEWGEKKRLRFEAFHMSDGTLRALGLLAAVYQRPTPSLVVIEEPEASMHPGALGSILDLFRHASKSMQVVVTTHSPEIMDAKWIRDEHLRIVHWQEGATRILPLSEAARSAIRQNLMSAGELMRSNALEAPALFEEVSGAQGSLFEDLP